MRDTLLYIHGFQSSPQSAKGVALRQAANERGLTFLAPDLNRPPREAFQVLTDLVEEKGASRIALLGSSLGGFYATALTERNDVRTCLVNPAVAPWTHVQNHIGENVTGQGGTTTQIQQSFVEDLKNLATPIRHPERYLVLLSTADEVLDWKIAKATYSEAQQKILPGENHQVRTFSSYVDDILRFILKD